MKSSSLTQPPFAGSLAKWLSLLLLLGASWTAQAAVNLVANPSAQAYRQQPVALTATVTGSGSADSAALTGSMSFMDNGQLIAKVPVTAGKATATVKFQTVGLRTLTASYASNATLPANMASAAVSLNIIAKLNTASHLIPSPTSVYAGHDITLLMTVSNGSNPTGTVTFKDGGAAIGAPVPLVDGKAKLSTSFLTAGTHLLSASYSGDVAHASSNASAVPITVTAAPQPALWFNTSGEVLFANSLDAKASLQLAPPAPAPEKDPRIVDIKEDVGVRNADGGLGYGKVPDPLGEGDGPWLQHRVISADGLSHSRIDQPVKRSEESMSNTLALGDEVWAVFEWFTPTTFGLGQLSARSKEDFDSATIFQLHAPTGTPFTGVAPYVALTVSSNPAFPQGYRIINIPLHTWNSEKSRFSASHRAYWMPNGEKGKVGKYFNAKDDTSDPHWPSGSVGVKEAWAFHIKLHYETGQFYTRAWMAKRGGPVVQIVNNTTTPNLPDIRLSGASPAVVANIKNGIYAFNMPNTDFDWRTMKRHFQVFRNQHHIMTSTGLSEEAVAAQLIRKAQGN